MRELSPIAVRRLLLVGIVGSGQSGRQWAWPTGLVAPRSLPGPGMGIKLLVSCVGSGRSSTDLQGSPVGGFNTGTLRQVRRALPSCGRCRWAPATEAQRQAAESLYSGHTVPQPLCWWAPSRLRLSGMVAPSTAAASRACCTLGLQR